MMVFQEYFDYLKNGIKKRYLYWYSRIDIYIVFIELLNDNVIVELNNIRNLLIDCIIIDYVLI